MFGFQSYHHSRAQTHVAAMRMHIQKPNNK